MFVKLRLPQKLTLILLITRFSLILMVLWGQFSADRVPTQRFMACVVSRDPWEKMINDADASVGNRARPAIIARDSMLSTISLALSLS